MTNENLERVILVLRIIIMLATLIAAISCSVALC